MNVNREIARVAIVTKLESLRASAPVPNVLVEYENKPTVNVSTATQPYVKVWINYIDGQQIGLGPEGGDRAMGTLIIEVRAREGSGTSMMNKLLTHFVDATQRTDSMFPVRTRTARQASPPNLDGWGRVGVAIPFWWDDLA